MNRFKSFLLYLEPILLGKRYILLNILWIVLVPYQTLLAYLAVELLYYVAKLSRENEELRAQLGLVEDNTSDEDKQIEQTNLLLSPESKHKLGIE